MYEKESIKELLERIHDLEHRLEESEQLIDAIKSGEVDAFAINNEHEQEIYTLQSGDYAYRILIEEFGEGAINVSEEGLIVYTNPYFCDLLKVSYDKVIGSPIFDIIHPDSSEEFTRLFNASFAGKSKGEISLLSGGNIIPVYISLTSLQPKLATVGIIISDLTAKKQNEKILLEYQHNLEQKNLELVQSNIELASFAYVASHDLQEPLRKIQTFTTRIMEKEFDNLSETGKDHFTRMGHAAKRMRLLIEDLLSYSRTNTLERKFEHADLNEILEEVKSELHEDIQQKKAVVISEGLGVTRVIPFQFRQLLSNLITNALKFSRPSNTPQIHIHAEMDKGSKLDNDQLLQDSMYYHICVSDNGIGFDQQYSGKIFDLFQRLHGKTEYTGTGIGLAIVKKIVENHHGIIRATGEPDKGARFDIYIPVL